MDEFVLDLGFGEVHQVPNSHLHVFCVVISQVIHLDLRYSFVKSSQNRHRERSFPLREKVQIAPVEYPRYQETFRVKVDIRRY